MHLRCTSSPASSRKASYNNHAELVDCSSSRYHLQTSGPLTTYHFFEPVSPYGFMLSKLAASHSSLWLGEAVLVALPHDRIEDRT